MQTVIILFYFRYKRHASRCYFW